MADKVLILFSGGIDSAATLHRVFTEHGDLYPIVHHINLINQENRHKAEAMAVQRILRWYRTNKYNFDYIEATFKMEFGIWDAQVYGMTAGAIAWKDKSITHIATGTRYTTLNDSGENIYPGPGESGFNEVLDIHAGRHLEVLPVFREPSGEFTDKQTAWELIPDELKPFIWSCRRPIYNDLGATRCHSCETCRDMNTLRPRPRNNLVYEI